MKKQHQYGLITAISMIVGICVGSGIFFKADDILSYTGGNVVLSVLIFIIGALCIIFGSITMSQLAARTTGDGGVLSYYEQFVSRNMGSGFAWFQMFVYYPTIAAVIAWVCGVYTCMLFEIPDTLENQILIGVFYLILMHGINFFSTKLGGYLQNVATLIKLVPLLGIPLLGLFWYGDSVGINTSSLSSQIASPGLGWLAAIAPMAFSYDGWIISTSITNEVKNPNRTMPIALTIGPLIVMVIYIAYFLGIVNIAGPEYILEHGNDAVFEIGIALFGANGGRIVTAAILIAVLGVLNGIVLGNLRIPQALANKGFLPGSKQIARVTGQRFLSGRSALLSLVISLSWLGIHYVTQRTGLLAGSDVGEIAIVFSYLIYIILYLRVMKLQREGFLKSRIFGLLFPALGTVGSLVIVFGGYLSNPRYVPFFLLLCAAVVWSGHYYTRKTSHKFHSKASLQ